MNYLSDVVKWTIIVIAVMLLSGCTIFVEQYEDCSGNIYIDGELLVTYESLCGM